MIVGLPRRTVIDNSPEIARILTDALNHASAEFVAAVRTIIRLERERIRAPGATLTPDRPSSSFAISTDAGMHPRLREAIL